MKIGKKENIRKYFKWNNILSIAFSVFSTGFIIYVMIGAIGHYLTKYILI